MPPKPKSKAPAKAADPVTAATPATPGHSQVRLYHKRTGETRTFVPATGAETLVEAWVFGKPVVWGTEDLPEGHVPAPGDIERVA